MLIDRRSFLSSIAGTIIAPEILNRALSRTKTLVQTRPPIEQNTYITPISYTYGWAHPRPLSVKELIPELKDAAGKGPVLMRLHDNRKEWSPIAPQPQHDIVCARILKIDCEYPNDPHPGLRINVQWEPILDIAKVQELSGAFFKVDLKEGVGEIPLRVLHDIGDNFPTLGPVGSHSVVSMARF